MGTRTMPVQKPGSSKQDVATDRRLIAAIENRYGTIDVDLAAHAKNAVCERFVSEKEDAFSFSWAERFPDVDASAERVGAA